MKRSTLIVGIIIISLILLIGAGRKKGGLDGESVDASEISNGVCLMIVSVFINPTEAGATDDYINLVDSSFGTTDAAEDEYVVLSDMVAHTLRVSDVTDPGTAGDIWEVTLMDDGVATALTCNVANAGTSCSDTSNTPPIAASSDLTIRVDSNSGTDPDASGNMRVSFCLSANT